MRLPIEKLRLKAERRRFNWRFVIVLRLSMWTDSSESYESFKRIITGKTMADWHVLNWQMLGV